jgi:hypothetical protein
VTSSARSAELGHRNLDEKRSEVSALTADGYSLEAVMREVDKCDVRCANCHVIRTREQRGWWRA